MGTVSGRQRHISKAVTTLYIQWKYSTCCVLIRMLNVSHLKKLAKYYLIDIKEATTWIGFDNRRRWTQRVLADVEKSALTVNEKAVLARAIIKVYEA